MEKVQNSAYNPLLFLYPFFMVATCSQYSDASAAAIAVVIPAAGSGSRMASAIPKQFQSINDQPVVIHTITPFLGEKRIVEVIIVAAAEQLQRVIELCKTAFPDETRLRFVCGGSRRQDSVQAGIEAATAPLIMVHDAARPLVTAALIARCCTALEKERAFVVAVPVADTIKRVANGMVQATVDRTALFRAQTPQGAPRAVFVDAFRQLNGAEVTDESALFERAAIPVHLVIGEESNFKITRQEDLHLARTLLGAQHKDAAKSSVIGFPRIGHGFDAHRLVDGRQLVIGGVTIPFAQGLDGHSDADVLTHALCDALLGAMGLGDIGKFFPDSSEEFKDICSLELLDEVVNKVHAKGFRLANADITIICQAPRMAPHITQMKENLCRVWANFRQWPDLHAINIKATTEEKMGYTGRREGISCHAVVLLVPNGDPAL